MNIPALIIDLAVMMLTAGIISIIFKKIKQPLILGYILAGFLLSPYFPWFTNILDNGSVETWSEIGIIFLMFHIGLEFNLHKMVEVGLSAILTCVIDVVGMLGIGYFVGCALGFSEMDSICLGGMLAMSSTMVIIKVFGEMGIKGKYAESVIGTLVIQDIVGIFLMVVLSTVAVSQNISGGEVAIKLSLMLLYLVIWLVLGIFLLPTFLDKTIKYMNDEMLMVVSIGICFGMVLLANWLGFSSALGAFLSGSLLAGTTHVERVEKLTSGVKDLFGAVFFISIGMMVNPQMIVKYIVPIIVLVVVAIVGKIIVNALGFLISGESLEVATNGGFALAQVGEFAFIIASLGNSLGVIDDFIYPIVVAVSVITIFTTPFCIKLSPKFESWLEKKLPEKILAKLNRFNESSGTLDEKDTDWQEYIKKFFIKLVIFGGIMFVAAMVIIKYLEPAMEGWRLVPIIAKLICTVLVYAVMALFIGRLVNFKDRLFTSLWLKKMAYRPPLLTLNALKIILILLIAIWPLRTFFSLPIWLLAIIIVAAVALLFKVSMSGKMATWYLSIETHFMRNLNERIISEEEAKGNRQTWLYEKLHIITFYVPHDANFVGKSAIDMDLANKYGVYLVKMKKGGKSIILPSPKEPFEPGDKLYLVGEKKALANVYQFTGIEQTKPIRTLKEYMSSDTKEEKDLIALAAIKVDGSDSFAGKTVRQSNIRGKHDCMLLGIQKDGYPISMPDPDLTISKGDILWLIGSAESVGSIQAAHAEE